jgi:uncharacterized protein YeeX (DUF496 family)
MEDAKQKEIVDVLQIFNRQLSSMIKIIVSIAPDNPDIDWVRRAIKILRDTNPEGALERCMVKLWDHQQQIRERNQSFFMDCPLNKYIKDDCRKSWIEGIVRMVRTRYKELSEAELDAIWKCINTMLVCVIKYKLLVQDHSN